MKPKMILAALGATVAAGFAASAAPADAAVSSAAISGTTATLNLDSADDNVTVSVSGGLLVHGQTTGGLNSGSDWDSATPGDQTVPASGVYDITTAVGASVSGLNFGNGPTVTGPVKGDFNNDGKLSAADVSAMMMSLADLQGYETFYQTTLDPTQLVTLGDFNGDSAVTNADIQGLIVAIANARKAA